MAEIWAQLVLCQMGGACSRARRHCTEPLIWFCTSRGGPYADPARRVWTRFACSWGTGNWYVHAVTHPSDCRDCSWLPWLIQPWLISIRVGGPGSESGTSHAAALQPRHWYPAMGLHIPAVTYPRRVRDCHSSTWLWLCGSNSIFFEGRVYNLKLDLCSPRPCYSAWHAPHALFVSFDLGCWIRCRKSSVTTRK